MYQEDWQKTCPNIKSFLFLYNRKSRKKFVPFLIVCKRWRHSQKIKTDITFDLEVIFFKCHIFWRSFGWKKITFCSGDKYRFKMSQKKEKEPFLKISSSGTFSSNASSWPEAVTQRCSVKKVLLKISQNSKKNTCAGVSF